MVSGRRLQRNEYVTATGQAPEVEDDFGTVSYAIVNPDVLTALAIDGGQFGPFNQTNTTNPDAGEVGLRGDSLSILPIGANWDRVRTIAENTEDFTGVTIADTHQILVVVDNDNWGLFDVIADTDGSHHFDFVELSDHQGVIGEPFNVYLDTANDNVSDYIYNNSFNFWANIQDVKSKLDIDTGKRQDQEEIILIAESRDVSDLEIGHTIQWQGSPKTYQVNDIFDSEFKFMKTIMANYVD